MGLSYTITGLDAAIAELKARGQDLAGPAAVRAVRAGGKVIEAAMVERAPIQSERVGPNSSSLAPGELKAAIKTRVSRVDNAATAKIGPTGKAGVVGSWVEYGHTQVKGGQSKVLANGKRTGKGRVLTTMVPPHPWARPAFETSTQEAVQTMADSLAAAWQARRT